MALGETVEPFEATKAVNVHRYSYDMIVDISGLKNFYSESV